MSNHWLGAGDLAGQDPGWVLQAAGGASSKAGWWRGGLWRRKDLLSLPYFGNISF